LTVDLGLIAKIDAVRLGYNGNLNLLTELFQDADIKLYKSMKQSMLDGHHNTYQIVYPQFLHSVADTG